MSQPELICYACISDSYLSCEVKNSGHVATCICCHDDTNPCWHIDQLSSRVKAVFDNNFYITSNQPNMYQQMLMQDPESKYEFEREGEPAVSIIQEITGLPDHMCESIISRWISSSSYRSYKDPIEDEVQYGDEALYQRTWLMRVDIELSWTRLQHDLLHRSRFFSGLSKQFFDELFLGIDQLDCFDGPILETYHPDTFAGVYRARVAFESSDVDKILEGLPHQLGAQRGRSVSAGRMNAAGVTVMYGALEKATCIAEVRAPVGSTVIIGKFNILRPVRVLNLKRLERCYGRISLFDPEHEKKYERVAFLRSLSQRLSVPVFNHNAHLDYLVTQCIAEYIASMDLGIDGVAFASVQAGKDAMNLVLFDRACHIAPFGHPYGTTAELHYISDSYESDEKPDPHVIFTPPDPSAEEANISKQADELEARTLYEVKFGSEPLPTLELDLKSLSMHEVTSIEYKYSTTSISTSVSKSQVRNTSTANA